MGIKKATCFSGNELILMRPKDKPDHIEIWDIGLPRERDKKDKTLVYPGLRLANIPIVPAGRLIKFAGPEFAKVILRLNPGDKIKINITVDFEQEE